MTSGGFDVEPDELTAHASHLDGLVDRLNSAVQAADYALSDDAYGLLCAFLPPIVNPTGQQAKDAVSAAAEGMQTTADNVRTTAQAYLDGDTQEAQPFLKQLASSDDAAGFTSGDSGSYASGSEPLSPRIGTTVPSEPLQAPLSPRIGTTVPDEPLQAPLSPRIGTTVPDEPLQAPLSPRIGTTVPSEPLQAPLSPRIGTTVPDEPLQAPLSPRIGTTVPDEPVANPSSFRIGTVTE